MSKLINIIKDQFSVVPQNVFTDKRLDYRSRGLLCTLLSLPTGWDFSVIGLSALVSSEEEVRGEGKSAIISAIKHLEKLGYLERIQVKDERGCFLGYDYKINIPPINTTYSD